MQKQMLAEKVLQKMKEKQRLEELNRPHFEVLRLEVRFGFERNESLKAQINELEKELKQESSNLLKLQQYQQDLDSTGKKDYPRIIVKPQFIASENVKADTKQFYRKSAQSFLKAELIRQKNYQQAIETESYLLQQMKELRTNEESNRGSVEQFTLTYNEKRVKVLKQDLRLRSIQQSQKRIISEMQAQADTHKLLLKEYELKKVNLHNREDWLARLLTEIASFQKKIEDTYNPIAYREYLKKMFNARTKTSILEKNLKEVYQKVQAFEKQTERSERGLQKSNSLVLIGRTSDSPSRKKGSIQKKLERQRASSIGREPKSSTFSIQTSRPKEVHRKSGSSVDLGSLKVQKDEEKLNLLSTAGSLRFSKQIGASKQIKKKLFEV